MARECITHHACDCIQARVKELEHSFGLMTKQTTEFREKCDQKHEYIAKLEQENAKLVAEVKKLARLAFARGRVVDLARRHIENGKHVSDASYLSWMALEESLRELDGEKSCSKCFNGVHQCGK